MSGPACGSDIVQVWKIDLTRPDWRSCLALLSTDERDRAARYVFVQDRRRFVIARAALRNLVGAQVHVPANSIHFSVQAYGKLRLIADDQEGDVRFNVSHSHDLALIAVSRGREVGIDVERIRPLADLDSIVMRHFAPAERRILRHAASADRLSLFYRYWTLKEAYVKAEGLGMHTSLDAVDVSDAGVDPIVLPAVAAHGLWSARTLDAEPGYAAALVVEGDRLPPLTIGNTPHRVGISISANG